MTAAVQAPVDLLNHQLKSLDIQQIDRYNGAYGDLNNDLYGKATKAYKKENVTEDEKQRRIFATSYEPSEEWWATNQKEYKKPEHDPLPEGFPEKVVSPTVWDGKVLINEPKKWTYNFTTEDINVLNAAYDHFVSLKVSNDSISRETFPIPADSGLFKQLQETDKEIKSGLGFRVLRGLPVDDWERIKQIVIFAGISSYVGGRRIKQGPKNIVHLRDITQLEADKRPAIVVKGQTSGNQVYHNDGSTGIVGLLTLGRAETGGLSQLASVGHTYNELAATRRDIVRELAKDDWKNKIFPDGKALIFPIDGDQIVSSYSRRPFFGFFEADADVPPLPTEKHLALDAIHFTAAKSGLDIELRKGDLEYLNNVLVFHARDASEDSEENARHLIRIHLENLEQPLPAHLREAFNTLNAGEAHDWPLEAWDE
ncbi:uncharacterized protein EHS24_004548 [Apiotrichum porosum]|uniref:TauD/TfdA-like domain-containing protein n=1 Tax=Apiotrichum porosum TaxID=105984 RepID=A0A427Y5F1_9TREE|nr:uncharacterized protein EHS24_004548 [Apiotrichum porosum]RSH86306.1 hypothetical protein EHS24_004548 [Apiotrichum porosum]